MIKQLGFLCVCAIPAAVWTSYSRTLPHTVRNESWLEQRVPTAVPGYTFLPGDKDPKVSYKMDETTYQELEPLGIVAQIYQDDKGGQYEVVVIAGDRMSNFHDQRVCFVAQGWNLLKNDLTSLPTKASGQVPIMNLEVTKDGKGERPAIFLWRSPRRFTNDRKEAKTDFFIDGLLGTPNMVGYSYRFMGASAEVNSDSLMKFASAYLDQLRETEAKAP